MRIQWKIKREFIRTVGYSTKKHSSLWHWVSQTIQSLFTKSRTMPIVPTHNILASVRTLFQYWQTCFLFGLIMSIQEISQIYLTFNISKIPLSFCPVLDIYLGLKKTPYLQFPCNYPINPKPTLYIDLSSY